MDDHTPPSEGDLRDGFFIRMNQWRFDLVQAQRDRKDCQPNASLWHRERTDKIQKTVRQVKRLIRDYTQTAERVNTPIDNDRLVTIIKLARDANRLLVEISSPTAIEQFLSESLYVEILELQHSNVIRLTNGEWRSCLDRILTSITDSF